MPPQSSSESAPVFETRFGEQFIFRATAADTEGDVLRIETRLDPGVRRPLHSHPKQEEHFLVHEGTIGLAIEDRELHLEPGDEEIVPAGTPHTFWRAGTGPARMTTEHRPALRFGDFLRAMVQLDQEGRLNEEGMPASLLDGAALLTEFRDEMHPADVPAVVQRTLFPVLARLGTLVGRDVPGYSAPIAPSPRGSS